MKKDYSDVIRVLKDRRVPYTYFSPELVEIGYTINGCKVWIDTSEWDGNVAGIMRAIYDRCGYMENHLYHKVKANIEMIKRTKSLESTIHISDSIDTIANAIDRKINHIYNEREANMVDVKFNDLEKDLKEYGITLSTIRSSYGNGDYACEIEGYFTPSVYKAHNAREKLTPVHPVGSKPIPKKVIFSGPATTILWKDGTKTTVKCSSEDVWDYDVGIAMCYLKKMLGNKGNYNNVFREAMKVAVVAEPKTKDISSSIDSGTYVASAFESMSEIARINKCINDAANALLNRAVKEKK